MRTAECLEEQFVGDRSVSISLVSDTNAFTCLIREWQLVSFVVCARSVRRLRHSGYLHWASAWQFQSYWDEKSCCPLVSTLVLS